MALTEGQRRCVTTLDRPLVVAAGAGSGKTFTLTKRIVGAVSSGYVRDIGEVCAITFTTKAAAELKSRIKAELRACGLIEQALRADEAWVSTIHGMCARILRAHAVELGIDPAFSVADGARVSEYLSRAVDVVLTEAQAEGPQWAEGPDESTLSAGFMPAAAQAEGPDGLRGPTPGIDALFAEYPARSGAGFGASVESMLTTLVGMAASQANGADGFVLPGVAMSPHAAVAGAIDIVEELLALAVCEKANAKRDDWLAVTSQQVEEARAALDGGLCGPADALRAIAPFKLVKTFGSKDYRARVDEARGVLAACVMEVRLAAAHAHLQTLVGLARRVLGVFAELKRADGVLDNNDLLVMAARAIEEHPDIAALYTDKFKLVMVDEFQDTDQMQVDMIKRLAGEGACRLCVVGDAQQSIYRFRGADVSVYRRHLQSVEAVRPGSVIELADNFRSHADVLAFVDRVFERPAMFGGSFMSLTAARDEAKVKTPFSDVLPRIVVQHTTRPWRGVAGTRVVEVAAARVADAFAQLVACGHSPGEMVVLLGRMKHAGVYAQALRDRGLPCVVSGGSVFAGTLEARLMEQLARVIANPYETQALFNVLTGPMFSLTAGDLLRVGGVSGFWRTAAGMDAAAGASGVPDGAGVREGACDVPEAAGEGGVSGVSGVSDGASLSPQATCALRVMAHVRACVGRLPVARIMERAAVDSGWLTRLQSEGAEGLAAAANVFKAIRMVGAVEQSGALGPASVAQAFADQLAGLKEAPGALSVTGGDSVRIMTVHASKGLEFPIVAVAEFRDNGASSARLLASAVEGRAYLSLDLGRTLDAVGDTVDSASMAAMRDYVLGDVAGEDELARAVAEDAGALHRRLALREYGAEGDAEEAKRLLYVALTRAREALVVSTCGVRTKDNPAGVPRSALAGVLAALDPTGAGFAQGRSSYGFGGTAPAVLECVALVPDDAPGGQGEPSSQADAGAGAGAAADAGAGAGANSSADARAGAPGLFAVPAPECAPPLAYEPYKPFHQGIFSYSSISDAAHAGDLLDRLAARFAVSVDEAANDDAGSLLAGASSAWGASSSGASFDDDFWDIDPSGAFDEDRATDLGTAFHRLAQYAVIARGGEGPLRMPAPERVEALSRTCNLGADQRMRLDCALRRWFGSELARAMASMPDLAAEVPFFVSVPAADAPAASTAGGLASAYLEGEIDLLGFDEAHDHATVVDYKTGGSADELPGELRRKHVLQAACYAYAIMLQGISRVDAVFVRVERPCAGQSGQDGWEDRGPGEPQCVRYRFEQQDIPVLIQAIAQAHALSA